MPAVVALAGGATIAAIGAVIMLLQADPAAISDIANLDPRPLPGEMQKAVLRSPLASCMIATAAICAVVTVVATATRHAAAHHGVMIAMIAAFAAATAPMGHLAGPYLALLALIAAVATASMVRLSDSRAGWVSTLVGVATVALCMAARYHWAAGSGMRTQLLQPGDPLPEPPGMHANLLWPVNWVLIVIAVVLAGSSFVTKTLPLPVRQSLRGLSLAALCGAVLTSGFFAAYAPVLLSVHVTVHVLLLVIVGGLCAWAIPAPRYLTAAVSNRACVGGIGVAALMCLVAGAYAQPQILVSALEFPAGRWWFALAVVAAGTAAWWIIQAVPRAGCVGALLPGIAAGVWLRVSPSLLGVRWFGATGRTWAPDALADQHRAGIIVLLVCALAAGAAGSGALIRRSRAPGRAARATPRDP